MKRLRVDDTVKEGSGPPLAGTLYRPSLPNTAPALSYTGASAVKVVSEGRSELIFLFLDLSTLWKYYCCTCFFRGDMEKLIQNLN